MATDALPLGRFAPRRGLGVGRRHRPRGVAKEAVRRAKLGAVGVARLEVVRAPAVAALLDGVLVGSRDVEVGD